ncbi:unnamed protein product, partial [Arabidopsis halleri]
RAGLWTPQGTSEDTSGKRISHFGGSRPFTWVQHAIHLGAVYPLPRETPVAYFRICQQAWEPEPALFECPSRFTLGTRAGSFCVPEPILLGSLGRASPLSEPNTNQPLNHPRQRLSK